jgi:hypothetical protein
MHPEGAYKFHVRIETLHMKTIEKSPQNSERFQKVLAFGSEILGVCRELSITPVVYGSLAYFSHTQDESLPVNDIDLLVPEATFDALQKKLSQLKGVKFERKPYHSIEAFKDGIEIDLDSIEYFLDPRSRDAELVVVHGIEFQIVNRSTLVEIYQEALANMPDERHLEEKRARYQKKLDTLKQGL